MMSATALSRGESAVKTSPSEGGFAPQIWPFGGMGLVPKPTVRGPPILYHIREVEGCLRAVAR